MARDRDPPPPLPPPPSLRQRAQALLLDRRGPLTRELLTSPARFGLGRLPERLHPAATTNMVCGFCSTGCGLEIHLDAEGQAINLSPSPHYPVNQGMACPKGWEALTPLRAPDRATTPLLRDRRQRGRQEEARAVDWKTALGVFVERFRAIQDRHGPASVAFLGTGQLVTEELALFGALAKFGMGMVHGDGNTRQCMATAVVAYKQAFGFDAPPYAYRDFEESDVIVLVGSNLCIAHPILWERICKNPHRPEIVVIDPRKTESAVAATRHLPLRPKSDLVLFYGLARLLIENGWIDRPFIDAHTDGFAAFADHVAAYDLDRVSAATDLRADQIRGLAELIHRGQRVSFWWTMGVNQGHEAVRTAQAIIDLALITGNIGRPGTGANSITGQCNAMGSRLFANTTNLLGGFAYEDAAHRARVAATLGIPERRIPRTASLAYDQILEGVLSGEIRGLWIVGTNPAHSWSNQDKLHQALERLEFVVVQDMYASTETARRCDLLLPAAGWGEKDGTFINSERRIGVVKKVARAPGQALADFSIFRLVAEAWGCADLFARWTDPEAVFQILKRLTAGRPCDITGIRDYRMLDQAGGIQWPFPAEALAADADADVAAASSAAARPLPATDRRLFSDGRFFHADGKARLLFERERPLPEPPCADYPFLLLTGRGSSAQWHTQTRTGKSPVLRRLAPQEPWVEINPADARALGIRPNDRIQIASRRARIDVRALVTPTVRAGEVFLAMHDPTINRLTVAAFDPYSRQPAYKACAVRVTPCPP